jgi:hypothetical protein
MLSTAAGCTLIDRDAVSSTLPHRFREDANALLRKHAGPVQRRPRGPSGNRLPHTSGCAASEGPWRSSELPKRRSSSQAILHADERLRALQPHVPHAVDACTPRDTERRSPCRIIRVPLYGSVNPIFTILAGPADSQLVPARPVRRPSGLVQPPMRAERQTEARIGS